jgi:uncharacterized SAM-binding protein YcdF (DUF218 family)
MDDLFELLIDNFIAILIITLILLYFFRKLKNIQIVLLITILSIFFSPLANIIVYSVERINSPGNINNLEFDFDKIVILSGNENIQKTKKFNHLYLGGSNNRLLEGIRIHNKSKKKIIFSGSSLTKSHLREVYVAEKFFTEFISDNNLVIIDNKTKNTEDTFLFLKENFKNEKHLIVTSAMHMQRCKLLAIKNGINYILYPVDFRANHENFFKFSLNLGNNVNLFQYGLREIAALIFYKISGKI